MCCTRRILKGIVRLWMLRKREREQEEHRIYRHIPPALWFERPLTGTDSARLGVPVGLVFSLPCCPSMRIPLKIRERRKLRRSAAIHAQGLAAAESLGQQHVPATGREKRRRGGQGPQLCVIALLLDGLQSSPSPPCGVESAGLISEAGEVHFWRLAWLCSSTGCTSRADRGRRSNGVRRWRTTYGPGLLCRWWARHAGTASQNRQSTDRRPGSGSIVTAPCWSARRTRKTAVPISVPAAIITGITSST